MQHKTEIELNAPFGSPQNELGPAAESMLPQLRLGESIHRNEALRNEAPDFHAYRSNGNDTFPQSGFIEAARASNVSVDSLLDGFGYAWPLKRTERLARTLDEADRARLLEKRLTGMAPLAGPSEAQPSEVGDSRWRVDCASYHRRGSVNASRRIRMASDIVLLSVLTYLVLGNISGGAVKQVPSSSAAPPIDTTQVAARSEKALPSGSPAADMPIAIAVMPAKDNPKEGPAERRATSDIQLELENEPSPPGDARASATANALNLQAIQLVQASPPNLEEARLALKQAYAVDQRWFILKNLIRIEFALGEQDPAYLVSGLRDAHLFRRLSYAERAMADEEAVQFGLWLRGARRSVGKLHIKAPEHVRVWIDGEPFPEGYARTDLVEVLPGSHCVRFETKDVALERFVTVDRGRAQSVDFSRPLR